MPDHSFVDYYAVLGIEFTNEPSQISKAYRKKALKCHPDKNPNNKTAAKEFILLSQAYEVLSDEHKKKAFDNVYNARMQQIKRNKEMDSKRRKLKEELERNEQMSFVYENSVQSERDAIRIYENAIKRLRAEGAQLLYNEKLKLQSTLDTDSLVNKKSWNIKLSWRCTCKMKTELEKKCYAVDDKLLKKLYPKVSNIVYSKSKNMAILEFVNEEYGLECFLTIKEKIIKFLPDHLFSVTSMDAFTTTSSATFQKPPNASTLDQLEDMILSKFLTKK